MILVTLAAVVALIQSTAAILEVLVTIILAFFS